MTGPVDETPEPGPDDQPVKPGRAVPEGWFSAVDDEQERARLSGAAGSRRFGTLDDEIDPLPAEWLQSSTPSSDGPSDVTAGRVAQDSDVPVQPGAEAPAPGATDVTPAGSGAAAAPAPLAAGQSPLTGAVPAAVPTGSGEPAAEGTAPAPVEESVAPADSRAESGDVPSPTTVTAPADTAPADTAPADTAPAEASAMAAPVGVVVPTGAGQPDTTRTDLTHDSLAAQQDSPDADVTGSAVSRRGGRGVLAGLSVLLVLLTAVAALFTVLIVRGDAGQATARTQALAASKNASRLILSYDYRHLPQDQKAALAVTTGSFKSEYQKTYTGVVQAVAKQYNGVVVAVPSSTSIVTQQGSTKVTALVFVNQQSTSTLMKGSKVTTSRVRMDLTKVSGKWLVSGLTTL